MGAKSSTVKSESHISKYVWLSKLLLSHERTRKGASRKFWAFCGYSKALFLCRLNAGDQAAERISFNDEEIAKQETTFQRG